MKLNIQPLKLHKSKRAFDRWYFSSVTTRHAKRNLFL